VMRKSRSKHWLEWWESLTRPRKPCSTSDVERKGGYWWPDEWHMSRAGRCYSRLIGGQYGRTLKRRCVYSFVELSFRSCSTFPSPHTGNLHEIPILSLSFNRSFLIS
jgi:hypothetical protein